MNQVVPFAVKDFYLFDWDRSLFPMTTSKFLIETDHQKILSYVNRCLNQEDSTAFFLPQTPVFALKSKLHLRRTVRLDPVAELFLFNIVLKNRKIFKPSHNQNKKYFGYRFENGRPLTSSSSYGSFNTAIAECYGKYKYCLRFDVASYFNSIYHHDIAASILHSGASQEDYEGLGKFLREINSGRSIDCLPQGIYPAKMIGSNFLTFIDNNHLIKSDLLLRFMDDFVLFDDSIHKLESDFISIQQMLGSKGLSVNPSKTRFDECDPGDIIPRADEIKLRLLAKRRIYILSGYDENDEMILEEKDHKTPLEKDEIEYIGNILREPHIDEEDAELILTVMREHTSSVDTQLPYIIKQFPNLSKNIYSFCRNAENKDYVVDVMINHLESQDTIAEYQLFWFAQMFQDYLRNSNKVGILLERIFGHPSATDIVKAKILETPDPRFGLREQREQNLRSGKSDWIGWASAVGMRDEPKATRNYLLNYFKNSSPLNHLFGDIIFNS